MVPNPCEGDTSERCKRLSWSEAAVQPVASDHHTTFIHEIAAGPFLYVLGGIRSDHLGNAEEVYSSVRRAPISEAGVGAWERLPDLPLGLAFHGQAQVGERVYLAGGITSGSAGLAANGVTFMGRIGADGNVAWSEGTSIKDVTVHPTLDALQGQLFLVGGSGSKGPTANVLASALAADGSNGPWVAQAPLPAPRSHHAAFVHDERLYVVGGFSTGMASSTQLLRSNHDSAGALTGWEVIGEMADPPWAFAATVRAGYVYLFGGGEGGAGQEKFVNRVRRAPLLADGRVGAFEDFEAPMPLARSHVHQVPAWRDFVYSVGGRFGSPMGSTDRVFVGAFGTSSPVQR